LLVFLLDVARIPALATSNITSGIFDIARIPNLGALKITTGVFDSARIPTLSVLHVPDLALKDNITSVDAKILTLTSTLNSELLAKESITDNNAKLLLKADVETVESLFLPPVPIVYSWNFQQMTGTSITSTEYRVSLSRLE
jgi:hypothetical protein